MFLNTFHKVLIVLSVVALLSCLASLTTYPWLPQEAAVVLTIASALFLATLILNRISSAEWTADLILWYPVAALVALIVSLISAWFGVSWALKATMGLIVFFIMSGLFLMHCVSTVAADFDEAART